MFNGLQVTMLGSFSIRQGANCIDDSSNRMRKVWLLLAYLIYNRNTHATQAQFISLIQGTGAEEIDDPSSRLKALFHRVRTMLNQLGDNAGHRLIVHKNGSYSWNNEEPVSLDVEEFDRLCRLAATTQEEESQLALYQQALALYQGDFLPKLSMDSWVMPIHAYYHQKFVTTAEQTLAMLEARSQWEDVGKLCAQALTVEPYSETFYQHLMRYRLATDDRAGALSAYEEMSELLFDTFGVMPSDESRALYREATRETNSQAIPISTAREQLRETGAVKGAMYCEYDFFKLLYQVQARALIRSGDVINIALFSLHSKEAEPLARRSLDLAMDNLQELLLENLRQGDVVSRCSVSQLIVMLPSANYENSISVCQRITRAFYRRYPHTPAEIHYSVQPLEPKVPDAAPESK